MTSTTMMVRKYHGTAWVITMTSTGITLCTLTPSAICAARYHAKRGLSRITATELAITTDGENASRNVTA